MLDSLVTQASAGRVSVHEMMDPLHPIGRIGMPNEVAELNVWLCSPRASFVTGANISVDGDYVAQ
jgi:NAD(P)-dependent dehydrogenase (short-subunit alcohol dehydrogenase family)